MTSWLELVPQPCHPARRRASDPTVTRGKRRPLESNSPVAERRCQGAALVAGVAIGASVAGSLSETYSWSAAVLAAVAVASAGALIVLTRRATLAPRVPA